MYLVCSFNAVCTLFVRDFEVPGGEARGVRGLAAGKKPLLKLNNVFIPKPKNLGDPFPLSQATHWHWKLKATLNR